MRTPKRTPTAADHIAIFAREIGKLIPAKLKEQIRTKARSMGQKQIEVAKVKPLVEEKHQVRGKQPKY